MSHLQFVFNQQSLVVESQIPASVSHPTASEDAEWLPNSLKHQKVRPLVCYPSLLPVWLAVPQINDLKVIINIISDFWDFWNVMLILPSQWEQSHCFQWLLFMLWEKLKMVPFPSCNWDDTFKGDLSLPDQMAFYDLVVFYDLLGHFSTHVTIPKASWKMAKTQGQLF